jgi:hypothetical protein
MTRMLLALLLAALPAPARATSAAPAAPPASEAQWIDAANVALAFAREQGLPITLEVHTGADLPGHTPLGLHSANGQCTLIVSARDNPTAARVSAMVDPAVLGLFLAGAAVHEVGHCHRRLHGYPHNERLLPVVAWIAPVRAWFARRIRTEEAYADMTAAAWLARYHRPQYHTVMQAVRKVRARFREPKHDTLAWIDMVIAHGPQDDGGNLFMLADKHLHAVADESPQYVRSRTERACRCGVQCCTDNHTQRDPP